MFDIRIVSDNSRDDIDVILHPGKHFSHPRDVLADRTLSRSEKRAILASWASDVLIPVQAAHHNGMMSPGVTE